MKLHIKNCVTDPRFKELRRAGSPVFKPVIAGSVLLPGAVRMVSASDLNENEALFLDSLLKSGSCLVTVMGSGPVNDMSSVINYLGFVVEEKTVVEEPQIAVESYEPPAQEEEAMEEEEEEEEEVMEEDTISVEEEEEVEDLSLLKNSDLRDMILAIDPDASVGNKSKKKLISFLLELRDVQ